MTIIDRQPPESEQPKCIVCKSAINPGAKKCLACGSRQDWLRFFDIGNTSLSLIIAAISVASLSADNITRAINAFQDAERTTFTAKFTSIGPESVTLFIDNDGPGKAIFSGYAMCQVRAPIKGSDLWLPIPEKPDRYMNARYPKLPEVGANLTITFGSSENPEIILAGESKIITLKYSSLSAQDMDDIPVDENGFVKSICTIFYDTENGETDVAFKILDAIQVTLFGLEKQFLSGELAAYKMRPAPESNGPQN